MGARMGGNTFESCLITDFMVKIFISFPYYWAGGRLQQIGLA